MTELKWWIRFIDPYELDKYKLFKKEELRWIDSLLKETNKNTRRCELIEVPPLEWLLKEWQKTKDDINDLENYASRLTDDCEKYVKD